MNQSILIHLSTQNCWACVIIKLWGLMNMRICPSILLHIFRSRRAFNLLGSIFLGLTLFSAQGSHIAVFKPCFCLRSFKKPATARGLLSHPLSIRRFRTLSCNSTNLCNLETFFSRCCSKPAKFEKAESGLKNDLATLRCSSHLVFG